MPELQQLRADHAPGVLAFELANRAYFAASIPDRGDEFYDQFTDRHSDSLAEQEAGTGAFYVLVAEDGSVLGRFNLYRFRDGTAELGYRVAQHAAGRGVATAAVRELCQLAAARHGDAVSGLWTRLDNLFCWTTWTRNWSAGASSCPRTPMSCSSRNSTTAATPASPPTRSVLP